MERGYPHSRRLAGSSNQAAAHTVLRTRPEGQEKFRHIFHLAGSTPAPATKLNKSNMILPFKPRFKSPILKGRKIHTLREDKHQRWAAGKTIHMATGVRSKEYNNFATKTCTGVQQIALQNNYGNYQAALEVKPGLTTLITEHDLNLVAINDGFDSLDDFMGFFFKNPYHTKGEVIMRIIHWTDLMYTRSTFEYA